MGHGDQTAKTSWQWNQTSNHSSLGLQAAVINLVIELKSHSVDIRSSRYHQNSFAHASGTEIDVAYISLLD